MDECVFAFVSVEVEISVVGGGGEGGGEWRGGEGIAGAILGRGMHVCECV